jgi:hypothetical protein
MSLVQSVKNQPILVEKYVSLPATAGTTVGIAVPAGTLVLAAGFEPSVTVPDVSVYTFDITDGTTVFANDLVLDNTAAGTIRVSATAGLVPVADTLDIVTTITGSPGVVTGRLFAVIIDVNENGAQALAVDRDQLA